MNEFYYELRLTPSSMLEELESFIMDQIDEAIETDENTIIIRTEIEPTNLIDMVNEYSKELEEIFSMKISIKSELHKLKNEDWINKFKEGFEPVAIGSFYIRASWHEEKNGFINIVVDPALAFGTGHHPTTKNSILAINNYTKADDEFLDIGCGSGILSLCATKLGATVSLCDTDEMAIISSKENFEKNHEQYKDIWIGSARSMGEYDIIVANIIADVLAFLAKDIKNNLKIGGLVILSGILDKYESKITDLYSSMELIERIAEDEWLTMVYRKK